MIFGGGEEVKVVITEARGEFFVSGGKLGGASHSLYERFVKKWPVRFRLI